MSNLNTTILLFGKIETNTPYNLFGVSCGFEDIEWAEKTINLVPLLVNELQKSDKITVNDFIKYWEENNKK